MIRRLPKIGALSTGFELGVALHVCARVVRHRYRAHRTRLTDYADAAEGGRGPCVDGKFNGARGDIEAIEIATGEVSRPKRGAVCVEVQREPIVLACGSIGLRHGA